MNLRWCIHLTLVGAFLGSGIMAAQAATAQNPYQEIVTRNVFGLVPIPTAPPPKAEPDTSHLPKITPNGIMTIFGKLQVLFKVAPEQGKPGAKEESYVMSVGDRQDGIVVQNIDEKSATITFNNHGTVQELALVDGKASTGAAPASAPAQHGVAGRIPLPRPGMPQSHGGAQAAIQNGGRVASSGNGPGIGGGPGMASTATLKNQTPNITPEEQVIMIEAQRMKAIEDNDPTAPLFPVTELTSQTLGQDGGDSGGVPAPPPAPGK